MMFANQPSTLSGYIPGQLQGAMPTAQQADPSVMSGYNPSASIPPMGSYQPAATAQQPAQAFTWGDGGARLSPDQLALRQKTALAQMQSGMDYSPVQSWTQGLARVANAAVGAMELKRLDKQDAAAQAASRDTVAALLSPGVGSGASSTSPVAEALMSSDPTVQKLAMWRLEKDNPKPVNNDSAADWSFYQQNLTPDQFEQWKANKVYNPPHFSIIDGAPAMVGGYQPPTAAPQGAPAIGAVVDDPRKTQGGGVGNGAGGF